MSTDLKFASSDDYSKARTEGFMRLFRYISGDNVAKQKIEMTAPVLSQITPGDGPLCASKLRISFFLPMAFQKDEAPPEPSSPLLYVSTIPETVFHVLQFSTPPPGPSGDTVVEKAAELASMLPSGSYVGSPYYEAAYDPPFRLSKRHDEVWLAALPAETGVVTAVEGDEATEEGQGATQ